jgi:hypothetical protein
MKDPKKGIVRSERNPLGPIAFVPHTCKNCGYAFEGNYCPSCGQSVVEVQQPVTHFLGDLLGSVFALDIRLIRSVPVLLLKPGKLSAEYIDGKRASHVAPFRLYFFSSLVFFFLIGWQTKSAVKEALNKDPDLSATDSLRVQAPAIRISLNQDSVTEINNMHDGLGFLQALRQEIRSQLADSTYPEKDKVRKQQNLNTLENPDVLISKIYQYVSYSFFLLMPLFGAFLYLFFRKKRKFYVEHLIYSVNLHTFFFMVAIIAVLISLVFPALLDKIGGFIFLLTVVYSVLGIRNFYKTRWARAIFSSLALFSIYLVCVLAVLVIGTIVFLA